MRHNHSTSRWARTLDRQRGTALGTVMLFVLVLSGGALAVMTVAQSSSDRASNERNLDEAAAIGEAGLTYVVQHWMIYGDQTAAKSTWPGSTPSTNWPAGTTTAQAFDCQYGFLAVPGSNSVPTSFNSKTYTGVETSGDYTGWAHVTANHGIGSDAPVVGHWFNCNTSDKGTNAGKVGRGRFCVLGIQNGTIGGSSKGVRVMAQYNKTNYSWQATVAANSSTPITGYGTTNGITLGGTTTFQTLNGGATAALMSVGNISLTGTGNVHGNVLSAGTISDPADLASGYSATPSDSAISNSLFPDQATTVNKALAIAQAVGTATVVAAPTDGNPAVTQGNLNNSAYWNITGTVNGNTVTGTTAATVLASALNAVPAASRPYIEYSIASNVSGWTNINGKQAHLFVRGNGSQTGAASTETLTLPSGNYAFARTWIDGATVVIQGPPASQTTGNVIVLPDLFVTNGGRLIFDTSMSTGVPTDVPPITILNQGGNQWAPSGITSVIRSAQSNETPTTTSLGVTVWTPNVAALAQGSVTSANAWTTSTNVSTLGQSGGAGTYNPPMMAGGGGTGSATASSKSWTYGTGMSDAVYAKPASGSGSYDEWSITNNAVLATITASGTSEGVVFYNTAGTDFVMNNGGYIMGGVQAGANTTTLETGTMATTQGLFNSGTNSSGFIGWSGGIGSNNARFDVNGHGNSSAASSGYSGLTYGAYSATVGQSGSVTGAFVGYKLTTSGNANLQFDPALASFLASSVAFSQHIVQKNRIPNPPYAILHVLDPAMYP